jgi:hypothetical protein
MCCICPPLEAVNHSYHDYLCHLKTCCVERGIELEEIGSVRRRPICKLVVNPRGRKRCLCFVAGLHGDEPAGPLGILDFLREANFSRFRGSRLIFIPVVNPTGFDQHRRRNWANLDLNRHFGDKALKGEPRIVWKALANEEIDGVFTLHEDPTIHRFYLYYCNPLRRDLCLALCRTASRWLPVYRGRILHGDPAENGLVYVPNTGRGETIEDRMCRHGIEYITIETPASRSLPDRVKVQKQCIKLLIRKWQQSDNWLPRRRCAG